MTADTHAPAPEHPHRADAPDGEDGGRDPVVRRVPALVTGGR